MDASGDMGKRRTGARSGGENGCPLRRFSAREEGRKGPDHMDEIDGFADEQNCENRAEEKEKSHAAQRCNRGARRDRRTKTLLLVRWAVRCPHRAKIRSLRPGKFDPIRRGAVGRGPYTARTWRVACGLRPSRC